MITTISPTPDFGQVLNIAEEFSEKVGVLLVANLKGQTTPLDDYETDSVTTEFLSNSELDSFLHGFEKAGIYCEVVLDEAGFIKWLNGGNFRFGRKTPLIYNLAQNGTGPARLTLVPGLCRLYRLPLLDSDGHAAALDQHKFHSISLLENMGLPVARVWWFTKRGWLPQPPPLGLRVIAKPTYECASIGVHKESISFVDSGIEDRLTVLVDRFRQPMTVQEFVPGFEVEVPILESKQPAACLAVGIELRGQRCLGDTILAYDNVFSDEYGFYNFAEHDPELSARMMDIAQKAHRALGFSGISRIDFRVSTSGEIKVMEVTCKPHVTVHSSFMYIQKVLGHSYSDLLKFVVGSAILRNGLRSV